MSTYSKASNSLYELSSLWEHIWKECDDLSADQFSKRLEKDTWSISEIIEHCFLAESVIYESIKKTVDKSHSISFIDRLKPTLVKFLLSLPIKVKTPTKQVDPNGNESLDSLKSKITNQLSTWNEFLNSIDEEKAEELSFKHPFFGTLDLAGSLSLIKDHLNKHFRQIKSRKALV